MVPAQGTRYIESSNFAPSTYDHRKLRAEFSVRSTVLEQFTGELAVRRVTTGKSPLSYVFLCFCLLWSRDAQRGESWGQGDKAQGETERKGLVPRLTVTGNFASRIKLPFQVKIDATCLCFVP